MDDQISFKVAGAEHEDPIEAWIKTLPHKQARRQRHKIFKRWQSYFKG
jgi:hypothetical protein